MIIRRAAGHIDMTEISARIVPNLWFNTEAEEAAAHYIAAFGGNGRILRTQPPIPGSPGPQHVPVVVEALGVE